MLAELNVEGILVIWVYLNRSRDSCITCVATAAWILRRVEAEWSG
jgi:hypothetical protein